MAGGDAANNPVAINVVPMVDVIFCLCVFFMCSMKFKQVEGKFEAWLPKDAGDKGAAESVREPAEIRIALYWDADRGTVRRQLGTRIVDDDEVLRALLQGAHDDFVRQHRADAAVVIDAEGRVQWKDVIDVVNLCKRLQLDRVEFALGKSD